jgi:kinesin family protein 6/9
VESGAAYTVSKLNLVDLAGSERLGKTNSEGQTQKEAMYINKSLTFLEQVVIALADKKRDHVPYRQSKLTHMLKDSLGGGCHTVLIANIWGDADQLEETTSTLRFATRMMCISSEPVQNILQDPLLLLKQYEQEIKSLRQELAMHNTLANRSNVSYEPLSENEIQDIQREVRRYLDGTVQDIELLSVRQIKETFSQFRRVVLDMQEEFSEGGKSLVVPSQAHLSTSQPVERKHSRTSKTGKQSTAESLVSEDVLVGDTDGQGFSLGIAPALSRGVLSPVVATKKMKNKGKLTDNEVEDRFDVAKETDPIPVAGEKEELEYLDTPPSREEAFEQFKKERGKEVNRVLMENKDILRSKRKEAHDLSLLLNKTKQSIDEVKQRLDQRKDMTGHLATSDGVEVMDESHFADLAELKKCKLEYRSQQANLDQLKLEISHCQQFVERSRQKLVQEFDHWYQVSFLGEGVEVDTDLQVKMAESDGELFDRLQKEFLKNGTDEVRFYNAKTRTDMRVSPY